MTCEAFVETKFRKATLAVIEQANIIIEEYQAQGLAGRTQGIAGRGRLGARLLARR